jgi:hypothetical protein
VIEGDLDQSMQNQPVYTATRYPEGDKVRAPPKCRRGQWVANNNQSSGRVATSLDWLAFTQAWQSTAS